jgi:hypothetical protein
MSRAIVIPTLNDTQNETSETFSITLGPAITGAALGRQTSAQVTIGDNDPGGVLQFNLARYDVREGTPLATITVTRTGGVAAGITVRYATADGTAVAGTDYETRSGTLSFGAGVVARTFTVPIVNDTTNQGSRSLNLILSEASGGATLGVRRSATLTIADDDGPVFQFVQGAMTVGEAAGKATITVRRVGNLTQPATVDYLTSNETALAGEDYLTGGGTLSFGAGVAVKTLSVSILNDTLDEADETLGVTLANPSAGQGVGAPGTLVLTIVDDDQAGSVQFASAVYSEVEGASGTTSLATITLTRTGGLSEGVTVDYATSNGTATAGSDYLATSGTLSFGLGQTSARFTVEVQGDAEAEGNESVVLTLSNPTGRASLGAQSKADLWIVEPQGAAKLIFIHHSTGENWLSDTQGQLGLVLRDNNYFVSDTNYGWGPPYGSTGTTIGDHTDIGNWYDWFRGASSAGYLSALYQEYDQHSSYVRLEDPDATRENEIVIFKSCFPNSNLGGDPTATPPLIGDNPLRSQDASSDAMTVANAKGIYNDLLAYFAAHPDKLFVVVTAPPLVAGDTSLAQAANARAFNDWLVNEWLAGYAERNVAVFDFFNVLTSNGGNVNVNDLGRVTGNHHRIWDGAVQHVHPLASDLSAYGTSVSDSHPTAAGGQKASTEFVALLNLAYNRWKGLGGAAGVAAARASSATRLTPDAIAPPGLRAVTR